MPVHLLPVTVEAVPGIEVGSVYIIIKQPATSLLSMSDYDTINLFLSTLDYRYLIVIYQ